MKASAWRFAIPAERRGVPADASRSRASAARCTTFAADGGSCRIVAASLLPAVDAQDSRILDDFSDPRTGAWSPPTRSAARCARSRAPTARRCAWTTTSTVCPATSASSATLPLEYPENYRFDFQLRGDRPRNDLQFKLVDASGDNVWWVNAAEVRLSAANGRRCAQEAPHRQGLGPDRRDRCCARSAKLEFTVWQQCGRQGHGVFRRADASTRCRRRPSPLTRRRQRRLASGRTCAATAIDGDADTAWHGRRRRAADARPRQAARVRRPDPALGATAQRASATTRRAVRRRRGVARRAHGGRRRRRRRLHRVARSGSALPAAERRDGPGKRFGLATLDVQPLAFAATPNDFLKRSPATSPARRFPRGFAASSRTGPSSASMAARSRG